MAIHFPISRWFFPADLAYKLTEKPPFIAHIICNVFVRVSLDFPLADAVLLGCISSDTSHRQCAGIADTRDFPTLLRKAPRRLTNVFGTLPCAFLCLFVP